MWLIYLIKTINADKMEREKGGFKKYKFTGIFHYKSFV